MDNKILILGGDGYLGWTLSLAFAQRTAYEVILADSFVKRQWEKEVGAKSLVPYKNLASRIQDYKRIFKKNNLTFEKIDLINYEAILKIIKKYKPKIIINAAQQPSAPFSMMNARNAGITFSNNIVGHLNVVWAILEADKNIKYLKLGSAGCYSGIDSDYIPLQKTDLSFIYKGRKSTVKNSWLPMNATDFYHQSKISDFLINELASNVWGLRIATIQQSTIFGATIPENFDEERSALSARFNYDAIFGTVINRFVCQSVAGWPLIIYGKGEQVTGLISLSDTVDNFINIAETDINPGCHLLVHNYTSRFSINEIADLLIGTKGNLSVVHIKNPRKELRGELEKEVEVHPAVLESQNQKNHKIKKELEKLIDFTKRYRKNIDVSIIMPDVSWEKREEKKWQTKKSFLTMQQSGR